MRVQQLSWILFGWVFWFSEAKALINIEITRGLEGALPIAVMPFDEQGYSDLEIGALVRADLSNSGRFKPLASSQLPAIGQDLHPALLKVWRDRGVENVVRGRLLPRGDDRFDVEVEVIDVYKAAMPSDEAVVLKNGEVFYQEGRPKHIVLQKLFRDISSTRFRALGHHISDVVYESLTGSKGHFSTAIAYVTIQPHPRHSVLKNYTLEVADYDGHNPRTLVVSTQPMMSPAWSPDGRKLAYVSFENRHAEIYAVDVATSRKECLSSFPGINGAPSWSPDGRFLALTLSKDGSPSIYVLEVATKRLQRLTEGLNIDTEPSFHPDGQRLLFTSNRSGGKPNLYQLEIATKKVQRLTFEGNYNARGSFSADGRLIVMMHRGEDMVFRIATQNLASGQLRYLTYSGYDESPSLAPNANMVIYATQERGQRMLGAVSMDGRFQLRLPAREGNVQEPAWSPFLL